MLQQTRVATVIPYYERWLARFPTVQRLAEAAEDDVLSLWSGLGYYSRARNLRKGAQHVVTHFSGDVPLTVASLLTIPGIGAYTAGAVASIAGQSAVPVVDGNVLRVFARLFGIDDDISLEPTRKAMWRLAATLVPAQAPGDYNQGLMELGALICTPRSPQCGSCPVSGTCIALANGTVGKLPVRKPRRKRADKPVLTSTAIWAEKRGRLLLGKRPTGGLYAGLWELPQAPTKKALKKLLPDASFSARTPACRLEQELTHRLLKIAVWKGAVSDLSGADSYENLRWCRPKEWQALGVSSATSKIINEIRGES